MPNLQPTVRQLEPLGRRYRANPVLAEVVESPARQARTSSPAAPARGWWRRRLTVRPSPSA